MKLKELGWRKILSNLNPEKAIVDAVDIILKQNVFKTSLQMTPE